MGELVRWLGEQLDEDEFEECQVVRLIALPYADRPGCRAEWRP